MRKLIKIFSVEETSLAEDLAELERRMKEVSQAKTDDEGVDSIEPINDYVPQVAGRDAADVGVHPGDDVNEVPSGPAANTRAKKRCAVAFHIVASVCMLLPGSSGRRCLWPWTLRG